MFYGLNLLNSISYIFLTIDSVKHSRDIHTIFLFLNNAKSCILLLKWKEQKLIEHKSSEKKGLLGRLFG